MGQSVPAAHCPRNDPYCSPPPVSQRTSLRGPLPPSPHPVQSSDPAVGLAESHQPAEQSVMWSVDFWGRYYNPCATIFKTLFNTPCNEHIFLAQWAVTGELDLLPEGIAT